MTDDRIAIGIIRTSFGVKGDLKIRSLSGEFEHFLKLKEVFLKDKGDRFLLKKVERVRISHENLIMKLEGIDTPEMGKALQGAELWVSREYAAPLEEDEFYLADLCRCTAYIGSEKFGKVHSTIDGSSSELLEIITLKGQSLFVPFIDDYVDRVDVNAGKIYLRELVKEL